MRRDLQHEESSWLQSWPTRLTPLVDLICIAGAGAGASRFKPWQTHLPAYCAMHVVQLPGRENRIDDTPVGDLALVVKNLASAVAEIPKQRPLLLFGHSMGAVLAFELAKVLVLNGRAPAHLIMSATTPPSGQGTRPAPNREELTRLLLAFDASNQSVVDNPELFNLLEPALRADFQLLRQHSVSGTDQLPDVSATLLSGDSDPVVPPDAVALWRPLIGGNVVQRTLQGGHQFPFQESTQAVIGLITEEMNEMLGQRKAQ